MRAYTPQWSPAGTYDARRRYAGNLKYENERYMAAISEDDAFVLHSLQNMEVLAYIESE